MLSKIGDLTITVLRLVLTLPADQRITLRAPYFDANKKVNDSGK